ncbi:MAG TPA: pirin family protein [Zoogloea sp.]|uniref:pirin family protein n=1 Tax=Zoogloea sp. TaxID=49181 RepID=UPI002CDB5FB6|nr:pirin family protein [Zoogloea sp.]HMV17067.1 pirin family protein [Rhodocyclaceae bacterium]HMV63594.1 pirin family protein [Rhodocyclaceae bacterium]HMW53796.1 pirin family protein [Rhodocyclaceae bacterium]HMY49183.1 pirin family protein [Rhodocyclaceae bacterium]HMZ76629.1 pirin family protein [Rhodocyclaceae bacterium]
MLALRRARDRGFADHGWLQSHHTFSFAGYHDPAHMGWGNLRVINEDRIAPGTGFGAHSHRDMEIVSYVLNGALAHRDSLGNGTVIQPGDVQRMTAGTGVTHSEFNDAAETTHFLQIWLLPARRNLPPGYAQRTFPEADKRGRLARIAAPDGADGAVLLHADACVYAGLLDGAEQFTLDLDPSRKAFVHLIRGRLRVNGQMLEPGDGAALADENRLHLDAAEDAEVLVFDLAP